jgi:anti-sigma-K factor RskA
MIPQRGERMAGDKCEQKVHNETDMANLAKLSRPTFLPVREGVAISKTALHRCSRLRTRPRQRQTKCRHVKPRQLSRSTPFQQSAELDASIAARRTIDSAIV